MENINYEKSCLDHLGQQSLYIVTEKDGKYHKQFELRCEKCVFSQFEQFFAKYDFIERSKFFAALQSQFNEYCTSQSQNTAIKNFQYRNNSYQNISNVKASFDKLNEISFQIKEMVEHILKLQEFFTQQILDLKDFVLYHKVFQQAQLESIIANLSQKSNDEILQFRDNFKSLQQLIGFQLFGEQVKFKFNLINECECGREFNDVIDNLRNKFNNQSKMISKLTENINEQLEQFQYSQANIYQNFYLPNQNICIKEEIDLNESNGQDGEFVYGLVCLQPCNKKFDNCLVACNENAQVTIWNIQKNECIYSHLFREPITSLCNLGNYKLAYGGGKLEGLQLWDLNQLKCYKKLIFHKDQIRDIQKINNSLLLTCSYDMMIALWNYRKGKLLRIFNEHKAQVFRIRMLSGIKFISSSSDKTIKVWNLNSSSSLLTLQDENFPPFSLLALNENIFLAGYKDGQIIKWNGNTGEKLSMIQVHAKWVNEIVSIPPNYVMTISDDHTFQLHQFNELQILNKKFELQWEDSGHFGIFSCAKLPYNSIALGSSNGIIKIIKIK